MSYCLTQDDSLVDIIDDLIQFVESKLMLKSPFALFDVAANLSHFSLNYDLIIRKAISVNVTRFLLSGYTKESNYENIKLCNKYPNNLFCCIGIHPFCVKSYDDIQATMDEMEQLILKYENHDNIVPVIGETGLDFSDYFPSPKLQQIWFEKHIELAIKLNLKLYIHERNAHKQLIETLIEKYKFPASKVLIHCFTGSPQELMYYIENGFYVSFSGWITKRNENASQIRQCLHKIPLSKIMLESDSPYHFVSNKRIKQYLTNTKQNEPIVMPYLLESVCKCYKDKYDEKEIAMTTTQNALNFFLN